MFLICGFLLSVLGPYVTWATKIESETEHIIVLSFAWIFSGIGIILFGAGCIIGLMMYFKHYSTNHGIYFIKTKPSGVTLMYTSLILICVAAVFGLTDIVHRGAVLISVLLALIASIIGFLGFRKFRTAT